MMDFFAAGGFQQLFSDLDEQQMDFPEMMEREKDPDPDAEAEANRGNFEEFKVMQDDSYLYVNEDINSNSDTSCFEEYNINKYSANSCANLLDPVYESLSSCNDKISGNHLLTLENLNSSDYNNNGSPFTNKQIYDECHQLDYELERSLNFLLPLEEDAAASSSSSSSSSPSSSASSSAETPSRLIQEVAEWEAQFLDNYIEIPELVDFLPDKTPLCTDTCELFLHESSKNLRLFRSKHKTKSSSALLTELKTSALGYPCTFGSCDKIYAKPAHLKAHMRRHLGEKPYICTWPECSWKFSRSDELARHRRSHSGVKPYKCDYCTKCFARSDHLAKHRKVHERRLLAANRAGRGCQGSPLPSSVFNVRPGRKRKNQT